MRVRSGLSGKGLITAAGFPDFPGMLKSSKSTLNVALHVLHGNFLHPQIKEFAGSVPRVRTYLQGWLGPSSPSPRPCDGKALSSVVQNHCLATDLCGVRRAAVALLFIGDTAHPPVICVWHCGLSVPTRGLRAIAMQGWIWKTKWSHSPMNW